VENVPALVRDRVAFGWLLGDLADLRFDAEWSLLSACAMGAPHPRERLLLVAYADSGDGTARLGAGQELGLAGFERWSRQGQRSRAEAGAWRDRVDRTVAASPGSPRDADGFAGGLVESGGNAVVPQVAEHIGRLIMEAAA
jgi:DNA (cytosine-5)-methyltransferase 1